MLTAQIRVVRRLVFSATYHIMAKLFETARNLLQSRCSINWLLGNPAQGNWVSGSGSDGIGCAPTPLPTSNRKEPHHSVSHQMARLPTCQLDLGLFTALRGACEVPYILKIYQHRYLDSLALVRFLSLFLFSKSLFASLLSYSRP